MVSGVGMPRAFCYYYKYLWSIYGVGMPRDAEIAQFDGVMVRHEEDVTRFEVPMHHLGYKSTGLAF